MKLALFALVGVTSAATGTNCAPPISSYVCDINSECCGTATTYSAVTVANGNTAGQTVGGVLVPGTLQVCYRKDQTEI